MRTIVDVDAVEWVSRPPEMLERYGFVGTHSAIKILEAPDGLRTFLLAGNGDAQPHFHIRTTSYFVLSGTLEIRDRTFPAGYWGLEPVGAIHPNTKFGDVVYGFGMSDGDAGRGAVPLADIEKIPAWMTDAGFEVDMMAYTIDTKALDWMPYDEGISMKLIHVFDGRSACSALFKAESGATLSRRRYLAPADMYILRGSARFGSELAPEHSWIHQSSGSYEDVVSFPEETEWISNTYGTVLDYDDEGSIARVTDGYTLRPFAQLKLASFGEDISPDALERAFQEFRVPVAT